MKSAVTRLLALITICGFAHSATAQDVTVELPTGDRGPIALDLDTTAGDQKQVQSTENPKAGDTVTIDVVLIDGSTGLNGFSLALTFDPAHLEYQSFATSDVFTGGIAIESKGNLAQGEIGLNVAFFGATTTTKASGTMGQAVFKVLDGFVDQTRVSIKSAQLASGGTPSDVTVGSGGAYVVIGGVPSTPAIPTDPVERADFGGDGKVDFNDFLAFAGAFGSKSGDDKYDARIDLNDDGEVSFNDFLIFAGLFGQTVGSSTPETPSSPAATVPDHPGANTAITADNITVALTQATTALNNALSSILQTVAASKQAVGTTKTITDVVINGAVSGTATITSGEFSVSGTTQTLKADIVFDDYSNDGQLWIGGPINIDLQSSIDLANPQNVSLTFKIRGDLAFSGTYKGAIGLDVSVTLSGGVPTITGTVTVGGQTITL